MNGYLIKDAQIVNEGKISHGDIYIKNDRIEKIAPEITLPFSVKEINAKGKHIFPGLIDDQVHFREPGLTHKGDIYSESKAAVAGGITSYMEMPNVQPQTLTQELLSEKYNLAQQKSWANYSFYMGASNRNLDEVLKTDKKNVCGIKIFMGSSTGDMLVDDESILEGIFKESPILIATHCEDETTIRNNLIKAKEKYGDDIPFSYHPIIRSSDACYLSSSRAISMAKRFGTRLHILHISTAIETNLFENITPLKSKRITSEACIHHLWFTDQEYPNLGSRIKWNPAVKKSEDREAIWQAVTDDRIDVIATDHAPHTWTEKSGGYLSAPSGGPLVQHSLQALIDMYQDGRISLVNIARKTAHAVADCFEIVERGYIREGYFADLVWVDTDKPYQVKKDNILYKCGWSPFENHTFSSSVLGTWVSGHLVYHQGIFDESKKGHRLKFKRS